MNVCPKCKSTSAKTAWLSCDLAGENVKTCKDCGCKYTKKWVLSEEKAIERSIYEKQRNQLGN